MTPRAEPSVRERREAMAQAIRVMRTQAQQGGKKLSTSAAAQRINLTRQTWEKYENAERDVILREDVQLQIAKALNIGREDLLAEYERRLGGRGLAIAERPAPAFLEFPTATTRRLVLQDDSLRPWAASGTVIVYDVDAWPQPEHGCVIEMPDGRMVVKIFVRADEAEFHLAELSPERRELSLPRDGARAYRVVARLG